MIDLADALFPEAPPERLNLGGGFFSRMPESLKRRWKGKVPEFADYAEAIATRCLSTMVKMVAQNCFWNLEFQLQLTL